MAASYLQFALVYAPLGSAGKRQVLHIVACAIVKRAGNCPPTLTVRPLPVLVETKSAESPYLLRLIRAYVIEHCQSVETSIRLHVRPSRRLFVAPRLDGRFQRAQVSTRANH